MRVLDRLRKAVREAAVFNPEIQVAPACILWPDSDHQWEAVIPILQAELPELMILGDYAPDKRTGPAIWLRCVLAGVVAEISLPTDRIPIFYLPGIGRQDLRDVKNCPERLKPLIELQYRGVIWSQLNTKDWTILAFIKSDQGGLGLDVAQDMATLTAAQLSLYRFLDETEALLKGKRLDKDYFNTLLTGGDPVRDLLQWLDQGSAFRDSRDPNEWQGFVEICKSQFAYDPENDGVLVGAEKLAGHTGPWRSVWERFGEAPGRYPSIPGRIRSCPPPTHTMFWHLDESDCDGWPQWNEEREAALKQALSDLTLLPPHEARRQIVDLEKRHAHRRKLVWAELGDSPLAMALEHLSILADVTTNPLAAGTITELTEGYRTYGWKADDAVLRTLAGVGHSENLQALSAVIRLIYTPWAEASAHWLQQTVTQSGYPGAITTDRKPYPTPEGECILFVDGLRFDTARRLTERLIASGYSVVERPVWAALPSVTATGKPAVSPVAHLITGEAVNVDFEPVIAATGQSLKGGYHLKKLLTENGIQVLEKSDLGNGKGSAWSEIGHIDHEGHEKGCKLAGQLDGLLLEIHSHILNLLKAGWKTVRLVTDHGWLLLPGGLPKTELTSALTENKWGRSAVLKPNAIADEPLFPWYWNPSLSFALADGISCYRNGEEYAHGGLSLQECYTLELTITADPIALSAVASAVITDVKWKGLRCTIAADGDCTGLLLDIRSRPGNPASSLVINLKPFKDGGSASVVVEDEELDGTEAVVVLVDGNDRIITQQATIIGGAKE
jgi:hypothetical protein